MPKVARNNNFCSEIMLFFSELEIPLTGDLKEWVGIGAELPLTTFKLHCTSTTSLHFSPDYVENYKCILNIALTANTLEGEHSVNPYERARDACRLT